MAKEENEQAKKTDEIKSLLRITARSVVSESEELKLENSLSGFSRPGLEKKTHEGTEVTGPKI